MVRWLEGWLVYWDEFASIARSMVPFFLIFGIIGGVGDFFDPALNSEFMYLSGWSKFFVYWFFGSAATGAFLSLFIAIKPTWSRLRENENQRRWRVKQRELENWYLEKPWPVKEMWRVFLDEFMPTLVRFLKVYGIFGLLAGFVGFLGDSNSGPLNVLYWLVSGLTLSSVIAFLIAISTGLEEIKTWSRWQHEAKCKKRELNK